MTDQAAPPANQSRPAQVPGGQVDEPADLQEGDHGLNGDLRAAMLSALEERWNADDPGATTLDPATQPAADPADGASQPSPATTSPRTPVAREEDGAGGGGEDAGEGAAPVDLATEPPPGTPPPAADARAGDPDADFSLDTYASEYFGTRLTRDQARNLFATLNGLQNLTPDQRAELDRVLAGGQAGQYPATTGQPAGQPITPGQPPQSSPSHPSQPGLPPGLPPRPSDDDFEAQQYYDRFIAPLAATTQSQLDAIQQDIARTTQAQLARERAEHEAAITRASDEWRQQHPVITDGEYDALVERISRSGVFAPLVNAHGSVTAATRAALDQFFWADDTLRARAIANIASGRQAGDPAALDPASPVGQQAASDDAQRQARAASVAGGGGSTTSRGQVAAPKDAAGRKAAMIQELAEQGDFS